MENAQKGTINENLFVTFLFSIQLLLIYNFKQFCDNMRITFQFSFNSSRNYELFT